MTETQGMDAHGLIQKPSQAVQKGQLLTRQTRRAKTRLSTGKAAASEETKRTLCRTLSL
ncbi:MAG: hypothetical protein ABIU05_12820 [Nitrospirales bacterium]